MKLIIAGSRSTPHQEAVSQVKAALAAALTVWPQPTAIYYEGDSRGVSGAVKATLGSKLPVFGIRDMPYVQLVATIDGLLVVGKRQVKYFGSLISHMIDKNKPTIVTSEQNPATIVQSYCIAAPQICTALGYGSGDILDRKGDLFKIEIVKSDCVLGYRSNLGTSDFAKDLHALPIDWECVNISDLVD